MTTNASPAYLCPLCRRNRSRFQLVYKLSQEIVKDDHSGTILFKSDEFSTEADQSGKPDFDVKCGACDYVAAENVFIQAAARDKQST